jgi:hypothetical protein
MTVATDTADVGSLERQLALPSPDLRHDRRLVERVVNDLMANFGCWLPITRRHGVDCWLARECVDVVRRLGMVVEGRKPTAGQQSGYRLIGWRRPPLWTHLAKLDDLLAESIARRQRRRRGRRQVPGQLSLW